MIKVLSQFQIKSVKMSVETSEVNQCEESLTKREMADLLIKDLEAQAELMIKESRRQHEAAAASITAMYKVSDHPVHRCYKQTV